MNKFFNFYKTIQTINYLVSHLGKTHFMALIKLVFLADRYHLRHYSFLITADDYKGMKLGPVGSATKDLLKEDQFFFSNLSSEDIRYFHKYLELKDDFVQAKHKYKQDELSQSEQEALDFVIANFGKFKQFQLADISHDYPEWKKYASLFKENKVKRVDLDEIDFLEDPILNESPHIKKYLNGIDPFQDDREVLDSIKEDLLETCFLNY